MGCSAQGRLFKGAFFEGTFVMRRFLRDVCE